jgi:DNA repair protein RadC
MDGESLGGWTSPATRQPFALGKKRKSAQLRRKLLATGASGLTDPELLCLLFEGQPSDHSAAGMAEDLVAAGGGLKALLLQDPQELCRTPGLGNRRAAQVLCALELCRRVQRMDESRPTLKTPADIHRYLAPQLALQRREVFHVLCLNARNTLLADVRVAEGTVDSCPVDPREVFAPAITTRATAVVLAHNHPSGDPEPSSSDLTLTAQLVEGGRVLGIRVLDHVIVGAGRASSLLEQGRMPLASGRPRAPRSLWNDQP